MKHVVGFSGGIDSQACARWVLNRFPASDVILLNSDAGKHEHPLTTEFVAEYSARVHPVVTVSALVSDMWKTPGFAETKGLDGDEILTFDEMARIKGRFPSRTAQFCTEILKLAPSLRYVREFIPDGDMVRYTGVRRDESDDRKNSPFHGFDDYFDCDVEMPLADWTKQMAFDYCRAHGEPINPLYSLGFERVGCSPCVNSGKEDIRRWADRSPSSIDKVRTWETSTNRTFFAPCVPGIKARLDPRGKMSIHNWVDEVVLWARTDHGGYQFNILKGIERPSCESRFGLCE